MSSEKKVIRKQVDISFETLRELKHLAIDSERSLKKYIEDVLVQHVDHSKKKDFKPLPLKK
jgi:hypothetical protein